MQLSVIEETTGRRGRGERGREEEDEAREVGFQVLIGVVNCSEALSFSLSHSIHTKTHRSRYFICPFFVALSEGFTL